MRESRFTEQQIAFALRQAETGTKVSEVCQDRSSRAYILQLAEEVWWCRSE